MIDIPALRALLAAEQQADIVMQANPGNSDALARACNLTGSLTEAAVNALPALLAIAEAAEKWDQATGAMFPNADDVYAASRDLRRAVDAARKAGT